MVLWHGSVSNHILLPRGARNQLDFIARFAGIAHRYVPPIQPNNCLIRLTAAKTFLTASERLSPAVVRQRTEGATVIPPGDVGAAALCALLQENEGPTQGSGGAVRHKALRFAPRR